MAVNKLVPTAPKLKKDGTPKLTGHHLKGKDGKPGKTNNTAGRPVGTSNKISGVVILDQILKTVGKPFEQTLAEGYLLTIVERNDMLRQRYEQMILNKVVADKAHLDVTSMGQGIADRQQSFEAILRTIKPEGNTNATEEITQQEGS